MLNSAPYAKIITAGDAKHVLGINVTEKAAEPFQN